MVPLSAVSVTIKHLEDELGTKLFNRSSNRISLNDNGRRFFYYIESMFEDLDNGISSLSLQEKDERTIKILAKSARETITRRICDFSKRYPDVKFIVDISQKTSDLNEYDVIIDEKKDGYDDFACFDFMNFKIWVECITTNPLCERKSLTLKQLKDQPFVSTNTEFDFFSVFADCCRKKGFEPNVVMVCNDYACHDLCVLSGMGLGITLGKKTNSPLPNMQYLDISDFNVSYTVSLYYKPSSYFGSVKAFIDFLNK